MRCNLSQKMHPPRSSDFCGLLLYPASLIAIKKDNSTGWALTNFCLARKKVNYLSALSNQFVVYRFCSCINSLSFQRFDGKSLSLSSTIFFQKTVKYVFVSLIILSVIIKKYVFRVKIKFDMIMFTYIFGIVIN